MDLSPVLVPLVGRRAASGQDKALYALVEFGCGDPFLGVFANVSSGLGPNSASPRLSLRSTSKGSSSPFGFGGFFPGLDGSFTHQEEGPVVRLLAGE